MSPRTNRAQNILLLIREAFASLLPVVLVMNILVLLSGFTELLESLGIPGAANINGDAVNRLYFFLIPLFINLALSSLLAKEKELDQIGTLLISMVCFFRVSGFLDISPESELTSHHGSLITSIPATLAAVQLLHYFSNQPKCRLVKPQTEISPRLRKTLNLLIPGLLTVLCFELGEELFRLIFNHHLIEFITQFIPRFRDLGQIQELVLFKIISQITWFLGIHGELSADGLFRFLNDTPIGENSAISLKVFHDVFMNIGGSGSTFIIPFVLLFSKKTRPLRSIAKLSLPFGFCNVNEILLFGLPIILNPQFFMQFFIVPFVNLIIALLVMQSGGFSITTSSVHWMSPPILSAYIASGGSVLAVLTQLLCIGVDGLIYYPFLVKAGSRFQIPLNLKRLFGNDAYGLLNEAISHQEERLFIAQKLNQLNTIDSAQNIFKLLRGGEFILYFQPKVDAQTEAVVGLESLLRLKDSDGKIHPPYFLPALYEQGLSKVIDQKVVDLAFEQVLEWRAEGHQVPPVSINFDKEFLLDAKAIAAFIARAKEHEIHFCLEITEHTFAIELEALASVIRKVRAAGHLVSIDDFGAGYSCLTSLLSTEADEIKLDRKLVDPPRREFKRGQILLEASVKLCHELGFIVVAEGVETISQLRRVRRYGVNVIQGYFTGRPMTAQQMSHLFPKPNPQSDSGKLPQTESQGDRPLD